MARRYQARSETRRKISLKGVSTLKIERIKSEFGRKGVQFCVFDGLISPRLS